MSQVSLSTDQEQLEFRFRYNFEEKEFVKNYFHAFYRPGNDPHWTKQVNQVDPSVLRAYQDAFKVDVPGEVWTLLGGEVVSGAADKNLDADISDLNLRGFTMTPFPFQRAGIRYGVDHTHCIIGDDMGLGKSMQSLGIAYATGTWKAMIVVCPATIKTNWQRVITTTIPTCSSEIWGSSRGPNAHCIIINYDNLAKMLPYLLAFGADLIIFDEAHYLKNAKAKRTKAAQQLAEHAERVLMLTGTPIMNRPSELTSLLEILGHLNSFGGWFPFVQRYCGAFQRRIPRKTAKGVIWMKVWDVSGARHLTELNQRLTDTCLIRRMKKDVLKELPSKFRCRVVFPIDNRPEYDRAKANLAAYCAAAAVSNKAFIELCKTLPVDKRKQAIEERKIEAAGSAERAEQLVLIETLKQITTRGKMAGIIEWVENFLETDQKLVVFAMHIEAQESLYRRFKGAARIVASDSHLVRQSNIDKFIKDAGCRLLVCSLLAGGTGVDGLQEVCNNVAFIELPWTPAQALQAEDRVQRIGQTDQVTAWYLLAENTIEEEIQAMLAAKQAVCDSVLDGSEVRDGSIFNELIDIMSGAPDAEKAL